MLLIKNIKEKPNINRTKAKKRFLIEPLKATLRIALSSFLKMVDSFLVIPDKNFSIPNQMMEKKNEKITNNKNWEIKFISLNFELSNNKETYVFFVTQDNKNPKNNAV